MDSNSVFEINLSKIFVAKAFKFCMKNMNIEQNRRSDEIDKCVNTLIEAKKNIVFSDYEKIN